MEVVIKYLESILEEHKIGELNKDKLIALPFHWGSGILNNDLIPKEIHNPEWKTVVFDDSIKDKNVFVKFDEENWFEYTWLKEYLSFFKDKSIEIKVLVDEEGLCVLIVKLVEQLDLTLSVAISSSQEGWTEERWNELFDESFEKRHDHLTFIDFDEVFKGATISSDMEL